MDQEIISIIELAIACIAAVYGWLKHRESREADRKTGDVVKFFDPADDTVAVAPSGIPGRAWKMGETTKHWLTFDHPPAEQESLLRQVAEAEATGLVSYTISVPSAWYDIDYGLIRGSGKSVAK